jgi:target of EGR1 protein 1
MNSNNFIGDKIVPFQTVPVVDVTKHNFLTLEPTIRLALANCDFVAIDCELSGLGDRKKLNAPSIEDRFNNASIVAKTRSIISLGLSIFKEKDNEKTILLSKNYQVQTYNIVVLCSEDYIIEPGSVSFLVKHGFNFNQQYTEGVPYYRGNDKEQSSVEENRLRNLFAEIIRNKKKVMFHNGFIDIVFLYQNLYAQLPQTLPTFLADLCEMFPSGIYDTKYIAEYISRTSSTFLEFVFKTLKKKNENRILHPLTHVQLVFPQYPNSYEFVEYIKCSPDRNCFIKENTVVCTAFATHGNCPSTDCPKSHDVDYILAVQESKKSSKKKKKRDNVCDDDVDKSPEDNSKNDVIMEDVNCSTKRTNKNTSAGHRAGMDAFMTGYSYAAFTWHKTKIVNEDAVTPLEIQDQTIANNMYLVAKEFPLLIKKSNFAKNSESHTEKYERIIKLT